MTLWRQGATKPPLATVGANCLGHRGRRFLSGAVASAAPPQKRRPSGGHTSYTKRYDPNVGPLATAWLALEESERILLVERYHQRADLELPDVRLHATIHVVVENQLAEGVTTVRDAIERVRGEGLSRHDAIHAVGSVLAEHLEHLLREGADPGAAWIAYQRALRDLSTDCWRADQ